MPPGFEPGLEVLQKRPAVSESLGIVRKRCAGGRISSFGSSAVSAGFRTFRPPYSHDIPMQATLAVHPLHEHGDLAQPLEVLLHFSFIPRPEAFGRTIVAQHVVEGP